MRFQQEGLPVSREDIETSVNFLLTVTLGSLFVVWAERHGGDAPEIDAANRALNKSRYATVLLVEERLVQVGKQVSRRRALPMRG
jgi:hypothetical protein